VVPPSTSQAPIASAAAAAALVVHVYPDANAPPNTYGEVLRLFLAQIAQVTGAVAKPPTDAIPNNNCGRSGLSSIHNCDAHGLRGGAAVTKECSLLGVGVAFHRKMRPTLGVIFLLSPLFLTVQSRRSCILTGGPQR
jgi:hypothetical protein